MENIIQKPVPVEVTVEKIIEEQIEHIIERPVYIDNIVEKKVEKIVEVPTPVE